MAFEVNERGSVLFANNIVELVLSGEGPEAIGGDVDVELEAAQWAEGEEELGDRSVGHKGIAVVAARIAVVNDREGFKEGEGSCEGLVDWKAMRREEEEKPDPNRGKNRARRPEDEHRDQVWRY